MKCLHLSVLGRNGFNFHCQSILLFTLLFSYMVQYSFFGSVLTIGGVIGGLISGKIADLIGRRGVSFFCQIYIS